MRRRRINRGTPIGRALRYALLKGFAQHHVPRRHVTSNLQQLAKLLYDRDTRLICAMIVGIATLALAIWRMAHPQRLGAEEMERRRCEHLANIGRITDGVILETDKLEANPLVPGERGASRDLLMYAYRIAGVTYQCAQDISGMAEHASGLELADSIAGQSVQVRYDPHNPGNSMLISETWTGLWNLGDK
jgi:hypothetical protein